MKRTKLLPLLAVLLVPLGVYGYTSGKANTYSNSLLNALFLKGGTAGTATITNGSTTLYVGPTSAAGTMPANSYVGLMTTCPGTTSNATGVECTSTTCPGYTARAAVANSSSGWTATTSSYAGVASVLVNAAQVPATPWTVGANAWAAGCSYGPCCFGIYTGSSLAASDLIMWGQLSGGAFTGTTGACTTCVAASTGTQVSFPIGTYSGGTCTAGICLTEQ